MSVSSEIQRISNAVADAYGAVDEMGGTMPNSTVVANLPEAIRSIPQFTGNAITVTNEQDEHGGIIKHITAVDISEDTVSAEHLEVGYTAHDSDGNEVVGALVPIAAPNLQEKSVSFTPSENLQSTTVIPDYKVGNYDGLSAVNITVDAISSIYVGSDIARRSSSDLTETGGVVLVPAGYYSASQEKSVSPRRTLGDITVNGPTVSVPKGYYIDNNMKSVATGTAGTPTATKGTANNHSITVTPSVTNREGYITGGTINGTPVSVSASELVSGNLNITSNGSNIDVTNYMTVSVDVAGGNVWQDENGAIHLPSEAGGGSGSGQGQASVEGSVNFIDYDGTILHTYTPSEFAALSAMPANPSHTGLIAQGWNWSLSDAKTHVATYGSLDIGQTYVTSSGDTECVVGIRAGKTNPSITLGKGGTVTVDWGDGSSINTVNTNGGGIIASHIAHNYVPGTYTIKIGGDHAFTGTGNRSFFTDAASQSGNAFRVYSDCVNLIRIGTGATAIGDYAFYFCGSLSSITIPNGVTRIGDYAFTDCEALQSVIIPYGVTSIGDSAFSGCTALKSIVIPNSVTSIDSNAFSNCVSLESIIIPNSVVNIGYGAFWGCKSLKFVQVSSGATSIGDRAFYECYSLSSITIPSSVTSIGIEAFYKCGSLQSISIPPGVTSISTRMFYSCYSLCSVTINGSITSIGPGAFQYCYSLLSVNIPNSVTSIGGSAFQYCHSMQSATIPNGVTSIEAYTFAGCYSLTSVTIPNSVTSIGEYAFRDCSSLKHVTIPDGVSIISGYLFYGCRTLESVVIPSGVTRINECAFYECYSLESVTIPSGVTYIGMYAFYQCGRIKSVIIPNGVTAIASYTFSGCSSLTSIVIPNSVTSIGQYAFSGCSSLRAVTIPSAVTSIATALFSGCSSLEEIDIPPLVTSIGASAFNVCFDLISITIPSSVTSIGANAFSGIYGASSIYFKRTSPPSVADANAFIYLETSCTIYVPRGYLSAYTSATNYPSSSTYTYVEYDP